MGELVPQCSTDLAKEGRPVMDGGGAGEGEVQQRLPLTKSCKMHRLDNNHAQYWPHGKDYTATSAQGAPPITHLCSGLELCKTMS